MPVPQVKSSAMAAGRWQRRASTAGGEYREGVEQTKKSWNASAKAAAPSYIAGVQEAQARNAFASGVDRAGDARWKRGVMEKGENRYGEGVRVATGDYERGIAPFLEVAGRTDLPLRGPTGSESNYQRSVTMAKAFRAAKTGRK